MCVVAEWIAHRRAAHVAAVWLCMYVYVYVCVYDICMMYVCVLYTHTHHLAVYVCMYMYMYVCMMYV